MRKAHTKVGPECKFTLQKVHKVTLLQTRFSYIKVKVIQSLNNGNKTSGYTHGRPSIEYHSSSTCSHSRSQPSRIEPGQMGLPENHKLSKAEYTNTQQDWPNKNKVQLDMQGFLAGGFVLPKGTKSWSLISKFSSYSSMLTILGEHLY
jgi:hypothetical protein